MTIKKCHRVRKAVGGGMRQAGIIAAASLHALTEMSKRIHEDTENAKKLAEVVAKERGFSYYCRSLFNLFCKNLDQ